MSATFSIFLIAFVIALSSWTALAYYWIYPWLRSKPKMDALTILVVPQMFRYIGLALLVPGLVGPLIAKSIATQIAGLDALTSILAVISFVVLSRRSKFALSLVWLMNLVGLGDLLTSVIRASIVDIPPQLYAGWYVVTLSMPALLVMHVLSFIILIKKSASIEVL